MAIAINGHKKLVLTTKKDKVYSIEYINNRKHTSLKISKFNSNINSVKTHFTTQGYHDISRVSYMERLEVTKFPIYVQPYLGLPTVSKLDIPELMPMMYEHVDNTITDVAIKLPFSKRRNMIYGLEEKYDVVETTLCTDTNEVQMLYLSYINKGYLGIVLINPSHMYEPGSKNSTKRLLLNNKNYVTECTGYVCEKDSVHILCKYKTKTLKIDVTGLDIDKSKIVGSVVEVSAKSINSHVKLINIHYDGI